MYETADFSIQCYLFQPFVTNTLLHRLIIICFFFCYRYLATGCSFEDFADFFKCGTSTASKIIDDVCRLIWDKLQPIHLPPCNKTMWLDIANKFKKKANFQTA